MTLLSKIQNIPLAFGGASISGEGAGYGFGSISESESIDLLHEAYDLGIRIFDTAPIYGFGLSESRMGKAFRQNRDKVFIVSKSGVTWHENKRVDMNNDPKIVVKMLEQSLKDLNSDYIDLYMVHWPDSKFDIRKTLEPFAKAIEQKKIIHVGLCNTNLEELKKASEVVKVEVVQSQFNFFETSLSTELFPYLDEQQISFMSWGTLDKGILTKRVDAKRKYDESDCRSWAPWWKAQDLTSKYDVVEKLAPLVEAAGFSLTEFALGFNLSYNTITTPICGARNSTQLNDLIKSVKHLPDQVEINKIIEKLKT
jgi:aryl-alcohol dehydrogenase-like predicted oxidoreductase